MIQKPKPEMEKVSKTEAITETAISGGANMLRGMALSAIISGYIIGPLLIFGGAGYWIYKYFKTPKIVLFAFIIFAFGVSNFLIFVRAKKDAEKIMKQTENADK